MKKTKIIIPAMGMLLLGTAASVTGTVAWFSMNTSVNVTGMTVKTTVGSNILISPDNVESNFTSALNQVKTGILEPASSVDGVAFFYHSTTDHVAGDGHAENTVFTEYDASSNSSKDAFDANYGLNSTANSADCLPYIDYSFYIKATNGDSSARNLSMSRCNITYKGGVVGDRAWRVALFAVQTTRDDPSDANVQEVDDGDAIIAGNLKSILRIDGAEYYDDDDEAVDSASTYGEVVKLDSAADLAQYSATPANDTSIPSAGTVYYKTIVRLWLEGEDSTCSNSTYAELSGDFRLDLAFDLRDPNHATAANRNGVTNISTVGSVAATGAGTKTASVTLTDGKIANGETASSYQWYNEATDTLISGATLQNYTNTVDSPVNVYCLVTTARGNVYRSNTVALIAANA